MTSFESQIDTIDRRLDEKSDQDLAIILSELSELEKTLSPEAHIAECARPLFEAMTRSEDFGSTSEELGLYMEWYGRGSSFGTDFELASGAFSPANTYITPEGELLIEAFSLSVDGTYANGVHAFSNQLHIRRTRIDNSGKVYVNPETNKPLVNRWFTVQINDTADSVFDEEIAKELDASEDYSTERKKVSLGEAARAAREYFEARQKTIYIPAGTTYINPKAPPAVVSEDPELYVLGLLLSARQELLPAQK